jgi:hypothetical protein
MPRFKPLTFATIGTHLIQPHYLPNGGSLRFEFSNLRYNINFCPVEILSNYLDFILTFFGTHHALSEHKRGFLSGLSILFVSPFFYLFDRISIKSIYIE